MYDAVAANARARRDAHVERLCLRVDDKVVGDEVYLSDTDLLGGRRRRRRVRLRRGTGQTWICADRVQECGGKCDVTKGSRQMFEAHPILRVRGDKDSV